MSAVDAIVIRGARVHNLKNISVDIPHNRLTVVTGVSGSGKSSLVFDTVYAEGQRRYVQSLSAYARQFLERLSKPDVDWIDGLAPPIAIRQKTFARNPRSTVATATELYDYLRLLYARAGETYCPGCGQRVQRDTVDQVAAKMLAQPEGSRWYVLFPLGAAKDSHALRDQLFELRRKGFYRLFQQGRIYELTRPETLLEVDFAQPVYVLLDRIAISADLHQRLVDNTETCYREAGEVVFLEASGEQLFRFSEKFACKQCGIEFLEPEPQLFSFNSPFGACPRCHGFGDIVDYSPDRVIPDPYRSLDEGAIDPWTKPNYRHFYRYYKRLWGRRVRTDVPYIELSEEERQLVWEAVRESFEEIGRKKYKVHVRVFLSRYRGYSTCPECGGSRLRREALWVKVGGKNLAEVMRMSIGQAYEFFEQLELSPHQAAIAELPLTEIRQRLKFLYEVGLDYITLDRLTGTLSGGEAQRIQLATCLGSRLVGTCYILDEPSIGLHSRDTERLLNILRELRDLGNTVLVVEHDADIICAADHIIDLGPRAGEQGGQVVFQGTLQQLLESDTPSLTGRYLRGELQPFYPRWRRQPKPERMLRIYGARAHNLKNIDVSIPLDMMVAVTGVSGSGKSSLVYDVLYQALREKLGLKVELPEDEAEWEALAGYRQRTWRKIEGAELLKGVVLVDQSPIGRTPRSNPVTYVKAFDLIRQLFANSPDARRHGYTAAHFSFNVPGGRCETCQGDGVVRVEMQFLADVELVCEDCKGTRYQPNILEVRYRGLNIHEVLQLTVRQALEFFHDVPRLVARLKVLDDVGLGYLRLGQPATTLSGGEAQRVKLAAHLALASCQDTLFLFDEPTTGLHFDDINRLLEAFQRLIHAGGSVLIVEHNLDVIRAADWVIDLGPEGGDRGGQVVAVGPPEEIMGHPESHTGRYLKLRQEGVLLHARR